MIITIAKRCAACPIMPAATSRTAGCLSILIPFSPSKSSSTWCATKFIGAFHAVHLRRQAWEQGVGGLDGVLSVCNHSSSCTFEGIADAGISFLGWEEGLDDPGQRPGFPHSGRPGIGCLLPVAHSGLGEQPCGGFPAGQCSWRRRRLGCQPHQIHSGPCARRTDLQLLAWRRRRVPRVEPRGARGSRPGSLVISMGGCTRCRACNCSANITFGRSFIG